MRVPDILSAVAPSFLLSVDLGTSHAVAMLRWPDGRTRPLMFDGQPVLPVGVFCDESGELHVGRDAIRLSSAAPHRFEPHPKRRAAQGTVLLGEREVSVSAMFTAVLRRIATVCAETTGALPEMVLTCPSTWSELRRGTLETAAAQAGFPPVRFVTEPVAAAHYFQAVLGRSVGEGKALAVLDFGAGTVDIAVIATDSGAAPSIVAEGGLDDFGGVDIDAAIVAHIGETTGEAHPDAWSALERPATDAQHRARRELWTEAREAKEMLSRTAVAPIVVPGVEAGQHLTRIELDLLAGPLLEPVIRELEAVRAAAEAAGREIDAVFLVGGGSRLPLLSIMIHRATGLESIGIEQPELAVAEGAATPGLPEATQPPDEPEPADAEPDHPPGPIPPEPPRSARRPRARTVRTIAVAALLLVLASAAVIYDLPDRRAGSGSAPFTGTATATAAQACPAYGELFVAEPEEIRGPHFTLRPSCYAVLTAAEADSMAEVLGEIPELEETQRLLVVHFPGDGMELALPAGSEWDVRTVIALGERTWEVDGVPGADSVYAAVADTGATATVTVTDAERAQTLDLASGGITDPIAAYYHGELGERAFHVYTEMNLESTDGAWEIEGAKIDDDFTVTRSGFDEAAGWPCAADEAVVTVVYEHLAEATERGIDWHADPAEQLRIDHTAGVILAESVTSTEELREDPDPDATGVIQTFTVTFIVPADLLEIQFAFDIPDKMYDEALDVWLYGTSGNETQYKTVDFAA